MPSSQLLDSIIASSLLAFSLLFWLQRGHFARLALDQPNHRSLHTRPVPRTGGLAVMAGTLVGWLLMHTATVRLLLPAVLLLIAVSFLDDLCDLSAAWRFLAHLLAAGIFVFLLGMEGLGWIGLLTAIPALVWMTNLYNFMDGSDGLAGGMALFGFGFYGLAAWLQGDIALAGVNWSIAATSLAFLLFNFHPARIFMGDAGSIPLGFLAAALGLVGWHHGHWPLWLPVLVFSPFIVDASVTLMRRFLRGEKIWHAHREHYYQRLILMGWSHRRMALAEYGLMLMMGGIAVWLLGQNPFMQWITGLACVLLYWLAAVMVDKRWKSSRR